jgi:hypothetical protein
MGGRLEAEKNLSQAADEILHGVSLLRTVFKTAENMLIGSRRWS